MKPRWRIPWLVALAFCFGLVMTIVVNLIALQREIEIFKTTAMQTTLTNTIIVAQAVDREAKQHDWAQVQTRLRRLNGQPIKAYYQIIAPDGRILADSRRIEPSGQLALPVAAQVLAGATLVNMEPDTPYLVQVTIPLPNQTGQPAAILLNVTNWESQFTAMQSQALIATISVILAALAVTAVTLALLWRLVVWPLDALRQLAEAVKQGEVEARAPSFAVMELQLVGAALNQMLARNAAQQSDNAHLFAAAQREIAERKQAEARLKASLSEKEALLKEIHHRVKNNLQVISSLLNLQSRQLTEQPMLEIFRESQNRIRSIAIIHEKLYQATDLAQIDFAEYVHSLVGYLFHSYGINTAITLNVNIITMALGVDTAIPCGLIINELVSNSLKYAFTPDQGGEICVALAPANPRQVCLTVSDNGRGLPSAIDFRHTNSFGLQLVNLLTEQLDGAIELDNSRGAIFKITFCLPSQ